MEPGVIDEAAAGAPQGVSASRETAGREGGAHLTVKLPIFEGPLDLLLHLVREHRLDIFDIPIVFITDRYVEMIERMRELNLDVAGEYLLMAATLAHIKSRMLLPRPEPVEEDEGEPQDPREELVRRLLAYQKYREAASTLARQDLLGRDVFARPKVPDPMALELGDPGLREVSVFKLVEALDAVLRRLKPEVAHEVMREEVSVADRISELVERLRGEPSLGFLTLFEEATTRPRVIATFLALLEMARLGLARIEQPDPAGEILVRAAEGLAHEGAAASVDEYR